MIFSRAAELLGRPCFFRQSFLSIFDLGQCLSPENVIIFNYIISSVKPFQSNTGMEAEIYNNPQEDRS